MRVSMYGRWRHLAFEWCIPGMQARRGQQLALLWRILLCVRMLAPFALYHKHLLDSVEEALHACLDVCELACFHYSVCLHYSVCFHHSVCLHYSVRFQYSVCLHHSVCLHYSVCFHFSVCLHVTCMRRCTSAHTGIPHARSIGMTPG